jgi:hypothetical protein
MAASFTLGTRGDVIHHAQQPLVRVWGYIQHILNQSVPSALHSDPIVSPAFIPALIQMKSQNIVNLSITARSFTKNPTWMSGIVFLPFVRAALDHAQLNELKFVTIGSKTVRDASPSTGRSKSKWHFTRAQKCHHRSYVINFTANCRQRINGFSETV